MEISDSAIGWICTTMTRLEYLNLCSCIDTQHCVKN